MLALIVVAISLGMTNFAASVGIGLSGVDARTRLRVGLVFGAFESGMPVVGLVVGDQVAGQVGHGARWVGAGLLIALGCYGLVASARAQRAVSARAETGPPPAPPGTVRLVLSGLALSLDNLVVGFALGAYRVPVVVGAVVIGAVSVVLSLIGLELGAKVARWVGPRGEQLAGLLLIALGIAIAAGAVG
jgi:manganese efflux pump family protein